MAALDVIRQCTQWSLYTQAFDQVNALEKLEAFASFNGADFYQLPRNQSKVTLKRESWNVPTQLSYLDSSLVPLNAGEEIHWKLYSA